jgi:hypothetical protein
MCVHIVVFIVVYLGGDLNLLNKLFIFPWIFIFPPFVSSFVIKIQFLNPGPLFPMIFLYNKKQIIISLDVGKGLIVQCISMEFSKKNNNKKRQFKEIIYFGRKKNRFVSPLY